MDGLPLPAPARRHQPGLIRRILVDPTPVLDEVSERYGSMCGFGAGPLRMAVVGDPTALRELFAMPTDHFRWGHKFNVLGFVVGKESMIVSDGDDHARRRASVQPAPFGRGARNCIGFALAQMELAECQISVKSDSTRASYHASWLSSGKGNSLCSLTAWSV